MKSMPYVWRDNSSVAVYSPLPIIKRPRWRASIPPRQIHHARVGGRLFPLSIYGEGVADRPGVRSHGLGKMSK